MKKLTLILILFFYLPILNAAEFAGEPAVMSFISIPLGQNAEKTIPTFSLALSLTNRTERFNTNISQDILHSRHLLKFQVQGLDINTVELNGLPISSIVNTRTHHSHQSVDPRVTTNEEKVLITVMAIGVIAGTSVVVVHD